MGNFQPLGWLDTFDLAASLRTRWALFKKPDEGDASLTIALRSERAFGSIAAKWPELKVLLGRVQRAGDVEFGRIWIEMLPAGSLGSFEIAAESPYVRTWLALRWNPGALLYSGPESWCLQPGWITLVNQRVPFAAVNMGETNAVALVVDSREKEAT